MFQIVERAVPPDIGRLLGGVSLLFTPFGLRGPPAINKAGYTACRWVEAVIEKVS